MNNPLISIIVPCYNVEKYLPKCEESIINQAYRNLEIILVDDGSPDNCGQMCDEYARKDSRIRVLHKENGGLSDARNVAIDVAKGDYFLFIDSDDYVSLDHVEQLFQMMMSDEDIDIAITDLKIFIEGTSPTIDRSEDKRKILMNADETLINMFYQKDFDTNACGKLYKRILFKNIRYPKGWLFEDLATTYKLIQSCKKIAFSNYKSYYYLFRNSSIEGAPFKPLKYECCIKIIDQLEKDKALMSPEVQKALNCRIVSFTFHILLEVPKEQRMMRSHLMVAIKNKRWGVLMDKHARRKARVACLLSFVGFGLVGLFAKYGKSRLLGH